MEHFTFQVEQRLQTAGAYMGDKISKFLYMSLVNPGNSLRLVTDTEIKKTGNVDSSIQPVVENSICCL